MPPKLSPSSDLLVLGKGQLFFARHVAGVKEEYRHMGNVETFELGTEDDNIDKFSSQVAGAPLYKRVNRRRDVTARIVIEEMSKENAALVLMGELNELTQTGGSITDEILTSAAVPGGYYRTAEIGPITVVSLNEDPGGTPVPLVIDVDYTIHDAEIGIIKLSETPTNFVAGETLGIDYTAPNLTTGSGLTTVQGGTAGIIEGTVLFQPDPSTGPKMMVELWRVSVSPDGALGLISDEYLQAGLEMAVQDDSAGAFGGDATYPTHKITYL